MQRILKNRILTKYILGLFFVFVFFVPFSLSLNEILNAQGPLVTHIAHAQSISLTDLFFKDPGTAIGNMVLNLSAAFTWMGGKLFDVVLEEIVFGMGNYMNQGLGFAIDTTWKIIRDICNLAFIFGFIYIGIRTILDPDNSSTKKMLAQVIIGALLINFSLFFTKVIIDFSNFTAVQIYNTLTVGGGSIAESVANSLGIITFFNTSDPATLSNLTSGAKFWFFFMASIFLLITAFVFFAAALLLIVRFVALILIMVFSPLLFAATVFPGTQGIASTMWKQLISHAFFAPAYLLLVLVSITLINGLSLRGTGDSFTQLAKTGNLTESSGAFSVVLQFFIVIFFMIAALMIAQKMGIQGGQMAINVGNNLRGRVQGVMGRTFIGRPASGFLDKYEKDSARSKNMPGVRGSINRGLQKVLDATGGDRAIRNTLEAGKKANFGSDYSLKDDKAYWKERKADRAKINNLSKIDDAAGVFVNPPKGSDADKNQEEFYKTVRDASQTQLLETVKELKPEDTKYKAIARAMTNAQFDKLMEEKEENFDDDKKAEVRKSREESFKSVEGDADATRRELHKDFRKAKDAAKISTKVLMDSAATKHITPDIFHSMIDQKVDIATQRKVYENLIALGDELDDTMSQYLDSPYIQQRFGVTASGTRIPHKSFKQKIKEAGKI